MLTIYDAAAQAVLEWLPTALVLIAAVAVPWTAVWMMSREKR